MFIIEELREDAELLPEELVGEVDGGVDDACAMSSDGVGNVSDADCVQMFIVTCLLHENLQKELLNIVLISIHTWLFML